jgi:hypothetical protein
MQQMKTTKKRPGLNEAFKQFQRLPQWPIKRAHEADQLAKKRTRQTAELCSQVAAEEQARFLNSNFWFPTRQTAKIK